MRKQQIQISVIVPAYNVENYIEKCLRSLKAQENITAEYIIIDDGSTDNSYIKIEELCDNDGRFRIFRQKNSGVSEARNTGLKNAKGQYIFFLDSDDYLLKNNTLSLLYNKAILTNADIIVFGNEQGDNNEVRLETFNSEKLYTREEGTIEFAKRTLTNPGYRTSVWNKLYKATLIHKNSICFFSYKDVISEDCLFNAIIFIYAQRILFLPNILYHYEIVKGSLSHQKKYENILSRNVQTIKLINSKYSNKEDYLHLIWYYYIECLFRITSLAILFNKYSLKQTNNILKQYFHDTKDILIKLQSEKLVSVSLIIDNRLKRIVYSFFALFIRLNLLVSVRNVLILLTLLRDTTTRNRGV